MPRELVKCAPDRDLYMEWSSVVEAPTFVGTRAEMAEYLTEPTTKDQQSPAQVERRLARTDEKGSSALHSAGAFWGEGEIYMQQGWLPRERFVKFAERWMAHSDWSTGYPDVADLLDPFEDEAS